MSEYMELLDASEKMLYKGIREINQKGDLNSASLEMLGEVVDAIKDIHEIKDHEMNGGSYERMMPVYDYYGRRGYGNDGYGGMDEYGRRRDSMGRYMDGRGDIRGSYRHEGDEDKDYLEWKMRNAQSEQEREMYRRKLDQMKSNM